MQHQKTLFCIVFVTFISFLGIALPYPIMAPLFFNSPEQLNLLQIDLPIELLLGFALGVYPIGQFIGSPILGSLSDNKGRKFTLSLSMAATIVGYLITAYSLIINDYYWFIISRFFTGFWEGNMAIARAVASDLHPTIDKSKSFGYLNASATMGYLCGPILGGVLSDDTIFATASHKFPFFIASFISLLAFLCLMYLFKETKIKAHVSDDNPIVHHSLWRLVRNKKIGALLLISFCVTIGFDTYYQFYPIYLTKVWSFNEFNIAMITTVLSIAMGVTQIFLVGLSNKFFKSEIIVINFGLLFACFLVSLIFPSKLSTLYIIFPLMGLCIGLVGTHLPAYVSNKTMEFNQGAVMGLVMSLRYLGDGIICIAGGYLTSFSIYIPFVCGSILVIAGIVLFYKFYSRENKILTSSKIETH